MPLDCSTCEAFAMQQTQVVKPCLHGGTRLYRDDASTGVKQLPLLHLMYTVCTSHFEPEERTVRATWRAPAYTATGNLRMPPLYTFNLTTVEDQVHHLIGMALAQRVRALPVWAQLGPSDQLEFAGQVTSAILHPEASELQTLGTFEILNGALLDRRGVQLTESWLAGAKVKWESLKGEVAERDARIRNAGQALDRLVETRWGVQQARQALARVAELRDLIAGAFDENTSPFEEDGKTLVTGLRMEFLLDWMEEQQAMDARRLMNEYAVLLGEYGWLEEKVAEIGRARERLDSAVVARDTYLDVWLGWQRELDFHRETESLVRQKQHSRQFAALEHDFALQDDNYHDPAIPTLLRQALQQDEPYGRIARQVFLYMHPRLKYRWTQPLACRVVKLLSSTEFLDAYHLLTHGSSTEPPLAQPGPFAKLGVFVMNALTPGSYDQRHRQLVQWELDGLAQTMHEYRMDPTIVCHSCGSNTYGAPGMRGWIRDHNPPTALVKAGAAAAFGMPTYTDRNASGGRQILLPQCQECSTRQGSVTNKVVALWQEHHAHAPTTGPLAVRAYVSQLLPSDADREDFDRLVLSPGIGWTNPAIGVTRLVTTGQPGSFAGLDDNYLGTLGDTIGCHTCTDVQAQTDPYRNVSWIADHQPPTALVERGLMELPQVVYPHCLQCSNTQSRLTASLVRLFDGCFGKNFAETWIETLKELGHEAV